MQETGTYPAIFHGNGPGIHLWEELFSFLYSPEISIPKHIKDSMKRIVEDSTHTVSFDQYEKIIKNLLSKTPCHLLVWGCCKDADLFRRINFHGKTVFLEEENSNGNLSREEERGVYRVDSNKLLHMDPRELKQKWPTIFNDNLWDIIIVRDIDTYCFDGVAKISSLYLSKELARRNKKGCSVFVYEKDASGSIKIVRLKTK